VGLILNLFNYAISAVEKKGVEKDAKMIMSAK
jgi:hypothetical protein